MSLQAGAGSAQKYTSAAAFAPAELCFAWSRVLVFEKLHQLLFFTISTRPRPLDHRPDLICDKAPRLVLTGRLPLHITLLRLRRRALCDISSCASQELASHLVTCGA